MSMRILKQVVLLLAANSFASCLSPASDPIWNSLFDGESLTGWHAYGGDAISSESWRVEDGVIISGSAPGEIVTDSVYGNFELKFEWRVTEGANSGVFYRVSEEGEWVHTSGLEYQVLDNVGQAGRPASEQAAACYGVIPAQTDRTHPVGEWNQAAIRVSGESITHSLNGEVVASFEFGSPSWKQQVQAGPLGSSEGLGMTKRGTIALQNYHGHKVGFRSLSIRRL
jgi:hypothetical protein